MAENTYAKGVEERVSAAIHFLWDTRQFHTPTARADRDRKKRISKQNQAWRHEIGFQIDQFVRRSWDNHFVNDGYLSTSARNSDHVKNTRNGYRCLFMPLDGATNERFGYPRLASSITIAHKGKVVGGVVFDISGRQFFAAIEGRGATRIFRSGGEFRTELLSLPKNHESSPIYSINTRNNDERSLLEATSLMIFGNDHKLELRASGCSALDICDVATATSAFTFQPNISRWGCSASALIAKEAGTEVQMRNKPRSQKDIIVAHPDWFTEVRDLLRTVRRQLPAKNAIPPQET